MRKVKRPLEASVERWCRAYAGIRGFELIKIHHGVVGMPDDVLLAPGGGAALVEFKRQGEKPSPVQAHHHARLEGKGIRVFVCRSREEFKAILAGLLTTASEL